MADTPTERAIFERYTYGSLALFLALTVFTALSTRSSLFNVLFGFAPTLLTIITSFFIFEEEGHGRYYAWILPFVIIPVFYAVWQSNIALAQGLSVPDLLGVNLFLTMIYLGVFFVVSPTALERAHEQHEHEQKTEQEQAKDEAPEHTYKVSLPDDPYNQAVLIGEKCKSLNYAMGQVYDRSAGAVKEIRDMIHIDRESYNGLVEYYEQKEADGEASITRETAMGYVDSIIDGVRRLNESEAEVFGNLHKSLKGLERSEGGGDAIIDVLASNSRSPVYAAKKTLMSTCQQVKDDLQR
jgi:hypothetical protein